MVSRIFQLVADAEWQKMLPLCSETDRGRGRVPPCSTKADSRGYPECDQVVRPSSSTCVWGENEEQFLHHNSPSLKSIIKASWAGSATGTTALSCVRGGMLAVQRALSHTLALMGRGMSPLPQSWSQQVLWHVGDTLPYGFLPCRFRVFCGNAGSSSAAVDELKFAC